MHVATCISCDAVRSACWNRHTIACGQQKLDATSQWPYTETDNTITRFAEGANSSVLELVSVIVQPQLLEAELCIGAKSSERWLAGCGVQVVLHVHAALLLQAAHDGLVRAAERRVERHERTQPILTACDKSAV